MRKLSSQNAKAKTAITAPAMPMPAIEMWVHTSPPMRAPLPMPRLKMPEKIDIATDVAAGGAMLMISDCIATLNAVTAAPHSTNVATTIVALHEAGHKRARQRATMVSVTVRNG